MRLDYTVCTYLVFYVFNFNAIYTKLAVVAEWFKLLTFSRDRTVTETLKMKHIYVLWIL